MEGFRVTNLDAPITSKVIDDVLGTAILVKLGLRTLRPLDSIVILDSEGYIIPMSEQAQWITAYFNA